MPVMNTYESSETYLCIVLVVVSYVGVAEGVARRRCRKFLPLYTTLEDWLSQRIRSDRDVAPSHVYVSQFGGGRLYYCQGLPFLGFYTPTSRFILRQRDKSDTELSACYL